MDFFPRGGPESLTLAIACFGNLPTQPATNRGADRPFDFDFGGIDRIKSIKMARGVCCSIGEFYSLGLEIKRTRIPPAKALKNLAAVHDAAASCAAALANLGPQERLMLHVFDDLPAGPDRDALDAQYNKMPVEDLPESLVATDGTLGPGHLSEALQDISLYLQMLIRARSAQLKQRRTGAGGLKFRRTAAGLFASPPEWALIDKSWRLFEELGLRPSSTVGGPVHSFARHIHHWVTGRRDSLDSYFKKYATCRLRLNKLLAEFEALARSFNRDRRELEVDCEHDQRRGMPTRYFLQAKSLWDKIQTAESTIQFGP